MFRNMTFVVAAAALALPVVGSAQDWTPMGPHQGAVTGNANGSFTDMGAGEVTTFNVQMTYFVTDVIEVGGGISFLDATGVPSTMITLVARENVDTIGRRTVIVRRDGPNGEILQTPKTEEDVDAGGGADD